MDRRTYLRLAGVAAGSATALAAGATTTADAAPTTRHGIRFETVVDMVEDAGCDPTGEEPCDAPLQRAAADRTLLKFPAGEYLFTEKNVLLDYANLGLLGEGEVAFTVPGNFNEKVVVVDRGTGALFENVTVDLTAPGATPGVHVGGDDDVQIHDVRFVGRGIHPDSAPQPCGNTAIPGCDTNPDVTGALYPIVRSPDGTGVVKNVVAHNGGLMGTYSRGGVFVGVSTKGTLTLEDCVFTGFSGNGLYCSRTNGVVRVEGGSFRNNDVSQVRLGSEGSYVQGAEVVVDAETSTSPNPTDALNQRGVRFEGAKIDDSNPAIRDCDVTIATTPNSGGGVVASTTAGEFTVENTRVQVDAGRTPGVLAKTPDGGRFYPPPPEPHDATLDGASVTGSAAGRTTIGLRQRPGSVVENCCVRETGPDRDGVTVTDGEGYTITDSTIDVTGQPVVERNATAETSGIRSTGDCPAPSRTLTIVGSEGGASYEFSVDARLEGSAADGGTTEDGDTISGTSASGSVGSADRDSYAFAGRVRSFALDGDATVLVDGETVDPARLSGLLERVAIAGTGSYEFTVSGELAASSANGTAIEESDTVSGSSASGRVDGDTDTYAFSGELTRISTGGSTTVTVGGVPASRLVLSSDDGRASYGFSVNGTLAATPTLESGDGTDGGRATGAVEGGDRDAYWFTGGIVDLDYEGPLRASIDGEAVDVEAIATPPNGLTISGEGSYEFSVSGELEKTTANGATIDDNDTVSGSSASGQVDDDADSYAFSGRITSFTYESGLDATLDGESIDLETFGTPSDATTLTIGGDASYELSVSGLLEQTTANGATVDGNDTVSDGTATGQVHGGLDSYAFTGGITAFTYAGSIEVTLDGEAVDPAAFGGLVPLNGFERPPGDPDGDGAYEDVNGDGTADVVDVQALFGNREDRVVANNPAAFDFNDDGTAGIVDVQALFAELLGR
jgi:hypothetical protein